MRLTRNQVLEVLSDDYVRTARAKGLPERTVVVKHALRAGLTPIVTAAGLDLAGLLGGAIISENIFSLPGLGSLAVDVRSAVGPAGHHRHHAADGRVHHLREPRGRPAVRGHRPARPPRMRQPDTRSDRQTSPAPAPYLSVNDLRVQFPTEDGLVHAVEGVTLLRRPRQDARGRRRVRLRQERDRARDHGPAQPQARARSRGEVWLDGQELRRAAATRRAQAARQRRWR